MSSTSNPKKFVWDDGDLEMVSDGVEKFNHYHDTHGRFTAGSGSYSHARQTADSYTQVALVHGSAQAHIRAADAHRKAGEMVHGADSDYHRQYRSAHLRHAKLLEHGMEPGRFNVTKDMPDVGDVHVPNAGGKDPRAKRRKPKAVMYMQGGSETTMKATLFNDLVKMAAEATPQKPKPRGQHDELDDGDTGLDSEDDLTSDELDDEDDDDDEGDPAYNSDKAVTKGAYAYTPQDGEPKLDISDARHVSAACAALSSGGFRGNRVQIPRDALPSVKAKVRAAWKKFNPDKSEDEMPDSIKKDAGEPVEIPLEFAILKLDEEQRVVYGFASVAKYNGAEITDLQNDVLDIGEITKAAHDFIISSRNGGTMHDQMGTGVVVESLVVDSVVKQALGITRPEEGWFIGYKATNDDTWNDIKAGKFTGFSIGGTGVRTPV